VRKLHIDFDPPAGAWANAELPVNESMEERTGRRRIHRIRIRTGVGRRRVDIAGLWWFLLYGENHNARSMTEYLLDAANM
jgi:hypothetical protein